MLSKLRAPELELTKDDDVATEGPLPAILELEVRLAELERAPDMYEIDLVRIDVLSMPKPGLIFCKLDMVLADVLLAAEPGLAFEKDRLVWVTEIVLTDELLVTEPGLAFQRDRLVWVAEVLTDELLVTDRRLVSEKGRFV